MGDTITALTGQPLYVFIGLTLVLFGGASWAMGRALALNWRSAWQVLPYGVLMGAADRFMSFALFQAPLLHPTGFLVNSAILVAIGLVAFRIARTGKLVAQYPWLYQRAGLFGLKERAPN